MIGTCAPQPGQTTNSDTLQSGQAFIQIVWTWDGVSTAATGCDGQLNSGHVWNADTVSHWVHFEGRKGTPKSIEILPGTDVTFTRQQMRTRGLNTYQDCSGLRLTDSAATPL